MTRLACRLCGYKTRPKSERIPARCPNCGKYDAIEIEPDADQLLHEII